MKKKKLHFRVHPNILNIIRDAYWFENRKDWAMECLESLGENMTLKMAKDLLEGRNGLTTHDGGITLCTTEKNDNQHRKPKNI